MNSFTFEDFDAWAEAIQNTNARVMLHSNQDQIWKLQHFELDGLQVQFGLEGSGTIFEGCSDGDGLQVFLPSEGVVGEANGECIHEKSAFLMESEKEFCISAKDRNTWLSVFIPTPFLQSIGYHDRARNCQLTTNRPHRIAALRQRLHSIHHSVETCPEVIDSAAAVSAASDVTAILAQILDIDHNGDSQTGRPKISRDEITRRSMNFIDQNIGNAIRVDELATAVDVSQRTLRTAFVDWFGVTPKRYLQIRQLHELRRSFHNSHPDDTSVTDLLTRHGIWEFGRFASRYRNLFGELPSASLRTNL